MVQDLHRSSLQIELSPEILHFKPGGSPAKFAINVVNRSSTFTSFNVELIAAGASAEATIPWYRLTPSVSSKIPPGDRTHFQVEIIAVPFIAGELVNSIHLIAKVEAPELGIEERQDLRLLVDGSPQRPLRLTAEESEVNVHPEESFTLPVTIENPNPNNVSVLLEIEGLDSTWLSEPSPKSIEVPANDSTSVSLQRTVPAVVDTLAGHYVVEIAAPRSPIPVPPTQVTINVVSSGHIEVSHSPQKRQLPEAPQGWLNPSRANTSFTLTFNNQSNRRVDVTAHLDDPDFKPQRRHHQRAQTQVRPKQWRWPWRKQQKQVPSPAPNSASVAPPDSVVDNVELDSSSSSRRLTLDPASAPLAPGKTTDLTVNIEQSLPWLGGKRIKRLRAIPKLHPERGSAGDGSGTIPDHGMKPSGEGPENRSLDLPFRTVLLTEESEPIESPSSVQTDEQTDEQTDKQTDESHALPQSDTSMDEVNPGVQELELHILPLVPMWLQGVGALLVLLLSLSPYLLSLRGHTKTVNTVQFSGQANEVISAANDGTIRRWQVRGDRLHPAGVLHKGDKAVRVLRYRPVNNNFLAAGFENGSILVYNLLSSQKDSVVYKSDDRIFALAFAPDSRHLFSGHGSGLVLEWEVASFPLAAEPTQGIHVDFAIQALEVVGDNDQYLAISGRYNRLTLFDRNSEYFYDFPYIAPGGQNRYITSLAQSNLRPNRFATADDQGRIAVWDIDACIQDNGLSRDCEPIDDWLGHGGNAVRNLAFSENGCYLASVGENGQTMVWALTDQGTQHPQELEGQSVYKGTQPLNAVDVIQQENHLLIVSGGNDTQVHLRRQRLKRDRESSSRCQSFR